MTEKLFIKESRSKKGDVRRAGPVRSIEEVRVRYTAGAVTSQDLFDGARAVATGVATIIDEQGADIPETSVVICRLRLDAAFGDKPPKGLPPTGVPVTVIDPSKKHVQYLLPKSMPPRPVTLSKSLCLPVAICGDATGACGNCLNNNTSRL